MRIYIELLDEQNPQFLREILTCILKILLVANKALINNETNILLSQLMEYGGVEKIDKLQYH
jgi:hypothetical protein